MPLRGILAEMLSFRAGIEDPDAGVQSYIYRCEIDSPVELDVSRDAEGRLCIGSTPPLYYTATTFLPSFHRVRFVAEIDASYGD